MKQKLLRSIRKNFAMLVLSMLLCTVAFAQKNVTGKVTSVSNNQPIAGATVAVKGTNIATSTAADGTFVINVPNDRSTLVISYVGYDVVETNVEGRSAINIGMAERTSSLSEVVVTGYTSQAKKDITGSVAVVNTTDLKSIPASNAESQLQGRASGVTVTTSARPGDGASVRIRGFSSFGGNEPLYIIDGVPGSLNSLNPNDIESMQVLKDAASASIYGSRASSGVIIITTKKGRQGTAKVSYNMYYGQGVPGNGVDILNPQEMADLLWLAKANGNAPLKSDQYGEGPTPRLPDYILAGTSSGLMEGDPRTDPSLYNLDIDNVPGSYLIVKANKEGTNWYDEVTRNAPIMNHNIAVSGGADRSRYLFSFDYFDQDGIVMNDFYKRYTARVNTEFNVKKNIRIGENLQMFNSESNGAGLNGEGTELSNTYQTQPIIPIYNINGDFAGNRGANLGNVANPVARRIRAKDDRSHNWNIFGNMYAEVDFAKHFTARTSLGGTYNNNNYYNYTYKTYENAENNSGSSYTEGYSSYRSWTWTNQLTYKNTFNGVHDLVALVGTEALEEWGRYVQGLRVNYFTDNADFRALSTGSGTGQRADGSPGTQSALFSVFGKIDYAYNDKFLGSFTLRRDGSSRFGSENRYGVFPAGSVGWRISREEFLQNVKWITDLKLRASYGTMGNQRINPANQFTQYASGPGSSNYDITGAQSSTIGGFQLSFVGNDAGKWETNTTTNVGFDATLFGGKTEVIFEWYQKKTDDLLFQIEQVGTAGAGPSGANLAFFNVASMKNTGVDLLITHRASFGSGANAFKLNGTFTFTTYKNEITKLAEGVDFFDYDSGEQGRIGGVFVRNEVGQPISSFYGYKVVGFFESDDDVQKSPVQADAKPGRFKYQDTDGDGEITPDDRVFFGSPNPDFTYGINLDGTWKGFDLGVFFYGAAGKEAINYTKWWTDFQPSFQNAKSPTALYQSWRPDGSVPNPKVAIQEENGSFSTNGIPNSYYLENSSYLRLKNLTLGYSLPNSLLSRFKIDRLRVYVQATNLLTITDYSGLDPEIIGDDRAFGFDAGIYPTVKQYLIGLNLNF